MGSSKVRLGSLRAELGTLKVELGSLEGGYLGSLKDWLTLVVEGCFYTWEFEG